MLDVIGEDGWCPAGWQGRGMKGSISPDANHGMPLSFYARWLTFSSSILTPSISFRMIWEGF